MSKRNFEEFLLLRGDGASDKQAEQEVKVKVVAEVVEADTAAERHPLLRGGDGQPQRRRRQQHMDKLHFEDGVASPIDGDGNGSDQQQAEAVHEKEAIIVHPPQSATENDSDDDAGGLLNHFKTDHDEFPPTSSSSSSSSSSILTPPDLVSDGGDEQVGEQEEVAPPSATETDDGGNSGGGATASVHEKELAIIIIPRNQSPHITLPNYDEYQKALLEELEENNAAEMLHEKQSEEQNAENLLENTPIRWDPPANYNNYDGGGGGAIAPDSDGIMVGSTSSPRAESEPGKVYCRSQNGAFGSPRNGGVLLQYQYELTVDRRLGEEWIDDILPNLEGGISDSLLPVLFQDECIPGGEGRMRALISTSSSLLAGNNHRERGNLRGGVDGGGSGHQRWRRRSNRSGRRLEVIVGIDSNPRDYPSPDKGEYMIL